MHTIEWIPTLQDEVAKWVEANFSPEPAHIPALGIVEELGELEEALRSQSTVRVRDAVADTAIFIANYCGVMDFEFIRIVDLAIDGVVHPMRPDFLVNAGRLAKAHAKLELGIRGTVEQHRNQIENALVLIVMGLRAVARAHSFDWIAQTYRTWHEVKERRWRCAIAECRRALPHHDRAFCDKCIESGLAPHAAAG